MTEEVNDPDMDQVEQQEVEPIEHEHDPNLTDAQNLDDQERAKAGLEPPDREGDEPDPEPEV